MATEYNPGYGNRGFTDVRTIAEAKELMNQLGIPYEVAVQQYYGCHRDYFGRERKDEGIHIYFMDKDCTRDYGYYTPLMNSVIVNGEPREWGIYPTLVEV